MSTFMGQAVPTAAEHKKTIIIITNTYPQIFFKMRYSFFKDILDNSKSYKDKGNIFVLLPTPLLDPDT